MGLYRYMNTSVSLYEYKSEYKNEYKSEYKRHRSLSRCLYEKSYCQVVAIPGAAHALIIYLV